MVERDLNAGYDGVWRQILLLLKTLTHAVFIPQPLQRSVESGLAGGHVVLFGDRARGVAEEELVEAA